MATSYSISIDLGTKLDVVGVINAQVAPMLNQAVRAVAQATASNWQAAVMRAKLWSGEKDAYARTIRWEMKGDFSAVVWSDYKFVEDIETGRPPRDLKRMLQTSMKVRTTKSGTRYLIIPFRHGAPESNTNPMPADVYRQAKSLTASSIIGQSLRVSGQAKHTERWNAVAASRNARSAGAGGAKFLVNQNKYSWGGRLDFHDEKTFRAAPGGQMKHQGMVRFNTSTPGAPRSTFLTFRVMSEKSRGWIVPAQPGQYIAKGVSDSMRPKAEAAFAEAVRRTLAG